MLETPAQFLAQFPGEQSHPIHDLRRFRYHTGTRLSPLAPDQVCPILFRDIGPVALAKYLRGDLKRLAGPFSPIVYMRTADYHEPYTDYAQTGRLVFLRPLFLQPFFSGTRTIYIAHASQKPPAETIGFVPGTIPLKQAETLLQDAESTDDLCAALGGRLYTEACRFELETLEQLNAEHATAEKFAEPIRRMFQSADPRTRDLSRRLLEDAGLTETDLCTAWHHLPLERREYLMHTLPGLTPVWPSNQLPRNQPCRVVPS